MREILGLGHVLLWPLALPAMVWLGVTAIRSRDFAAPGTIITVLFVSAYLPWILVSAIGQDTYAYYLLPGLPFMYLGFGAIAARLSRRRTGRVAAVLVGVAAVGSWAFFMPVLTGAPLTRAAWEQRVWFRDCTPVAGPVAGRASLGEGVDSSGIDGLVPTRTRASGWCWI